MKKILLIAVLVVVAVVGGIKLYFWYEISHFADKLVAHAAPFAQVTYGGVITTYGGKVGLRDITIRPNGYDTTITADAVTFEADNLWALYNLGKTVKEGHIPRHLRFNLVNVTFDPSSRLLQKKIKGTPGLWGNLKLPYDALYCGHRKLFSSSDYSAMGVHAVTTTAHFGYEFEPGSGGVTVHVIEDTPGFNDVSLRLDFTTDSMGPILAAIMHGKMSLVGGRFELTDRGWNKKVRDFCASEMGVSEAEYVDGYTKAVLQVFSAKGVHPSAALVKTYRKFVAGDHGQVTLSLDMRRMVSLKNLQFYSTSDALFYLNPKIAIDGEAFTAQDLLPPKLVASRVAAQRAREKKKQQEKLKQQKKIQYAFTPVSLDHIDQYVGRMVLLKTGPRDFKGILKKVGERAMYLRAYNYTGYHQELVPFDVVTSASVGTPVKKAGKSQAQGKSSPEPSKSDSA